MFHSPNYRSRGGSRRPPDADSERPYAHDLCLVKSTRAFVPIKVFFPSLRTRDVGRALHSQVYVHTRGASAFALKVHACRSHCQRHRTSPFPPFSVILRGDKKESCVLLLYNLCGALIFIQIDSPLFYSSFLLYLRNQLSRM